MISQSTTNPAPPPEVIAEFLFALQGIVSPNDRLVPVLRGSALLRRWFAKAARPAADIDLEWFPQPAWETRFASDVEHARSLCMFAVSDHGGAPIKFVPDVTGPVGTVSLWDYGTPGVRCYTGWTWATRGLHGVLQVDVAVAGSYELDGVAPERVEFPREWGEAASPLAYSQEMLLAAKLSWIVRYLGNDSESARRANFEFHGEPKDIIDAYLLVTAGHIRPEVFQNAFFAVAAEDRMSWSLLDMLLDENLAFGDVKTFRHDVVINTLGTRALSCAAMLGETVARLRPLIADMLQHRPFLLAIIADPADEVGFLLYADWLERRNDLRGSFVRLYIRHHFHRESESGPLAWDSLPPWSGGWLYHLLGGPKRARELCGQLRTR